MAIFRVYMYRDFEASGPDHAVTLMKRELNLFNDHVMYAGARRVDMLPDAAEHAPDYLLVTDRDGRRLSPCSRCHEMMDGSEVPHGCLEARR